MNYTLTLFYLILIKFDKGMDSNTWPIQDCSNFDTEMTVLSNLVKIESLESKKN